MNESGIFAGIRALLEAFVHPQDSKVLEGTMTIIQGALGQSAVMVFCEYAKERTKTKGDPAHNIRWVISDKISRIDTTDTDKDWGCRHELPVEGICISEQVYVFDAEVTADLVWSEMCKTVR